MYSRKTVLIGITLIELMIAIFLSCLILFLISTLYLGVQKNRQMNAAMETLQDNIRMTTHFLSKAIRDAGYAISDDKIHAYTGNELKSGTDAFTVRGASTKTASLMRDMEELNKLCVSDDPHFAVGDRVAIHDIHSAEIFTVKAMDKKDLCEQILADIALQKLYPKNAEVSAYLVNTYFIGKTDRLNSDGSPLYALYVKDITMHKTELIEGVSSMKIQYSVWFDGRMQDILASDISDWSKVKGASMALTFSSQNAFPLTKTAFIYAAIRE